MALNPNPYVANNKVEFVYLFIPGVLQDARCGEAMPLPEEIRFSMLKHIVKKLGQNVAQRLLVLDAKCTSELIRFIERCLEVLRVPDGEKWFVLIAFEIYLRIRGYGKKTRCSH